PLRRAAVVDDGVAELVCLHVEVADRFVAVHGVHLLHGLLVGHGCVSYSFPLAGFAPVPAGAVRSLSARAAAMTPAPRASRAPCARATVSVSSSGCPLRRWPLVYDAP